MNEKKKPVLGQEAVTDARTLGVPRMLILGLQHLFAMFGATVLVPILVQDYGLPLSIQTTLLMAGLGTLLFHVCTGRHRDRRSAVPDPRSAVQGAGGQDRHALLPPHCYRPHDHHDRTEPLRLCHQ